MILRKCLSTIVLCLVMIFSGMCIFAEEQYTEGDLYYTIEDGGIVITGYFGNDKKVVIPNQIAGIPVYKIAPGAFSGTTVEELVLPDTIMTISESSISPDIQVESFADSDKKEKTNEGNAKSSEERKNNESKKESTEETTTNQITEEVSVEEEVEIEDIKHSSESTHESSDKENVEKQSTLRSFPSNLMYFGAIAIVIVVLLVAGSRKRKRSERI